MDNLFRERIGAVGFAHVGNHNLAAESLRRGVRKSRQLCVKHLHCPLSLPRARE